MRRVKSRKLELRPRKLDPIDPIKELRELKEDDLKRAAGGNAEFVINNCC